jgi:arylsulfatase A-like enzyme
MDTEHLPVEKQKELIHGYYAAMSYTDAQIMMLLNELDRLGIRKNTIIVLWGDHGWHLGDHGLWNKHTNFEEAAHALMMISVPGQKAGTKAEATSEFVDIFPTLCDLVNIPKPSYLDGISLVPVIKDPSAEVREYALSQYPRGNDRMGYSIRTKRFRYTVWFGKAFRTWMPYDPKTVLARELYDYEKDPLEKENVADKADYKKEREMMDKLFMDCLKREFNTCASYAKIADFRAPVSTAK